MREQIEQYREILNNAPEGATHADYNGIYYFPECYEYAGIPAARDLEDIRTIVKQHDRIAELERERDELKLERGWLLRIARKTTQRK